MSTERMIKSIVDAIEKYEAGHRSERYRAGWARRGLSDTEGARENRARRLAESQGLVLRKSRRDLGDGHWLVADASTNGLVSPERGMCFEEVEAFLTPARRDIEPLRRSATLPILPVEMSR